MPIMSRTNHYRLTHFAISKNSAHLPRGLEQRSEQIFGRHVNYSITSKYL